MKKNLFTGLLLALAVTSLCSARVSIDQIEEHIEKGDLGRVRALFKRLEREKRSPEQKKKLYDNLADTAAEMVDQRRESVSLVGSWKDMAKTGFGTLLTLGGIVGIAGGYYVRSQAQAPVHGYGGHGGNQGPPARSVTLSKVGLYGGPVLAAGGLYLLYKGITCSTQWGWVENAREIEKFIADKALDDENPTEEL